MLGEEAARRTDWDDLENVVVDVEITDWPTATQNPRGRVVEILGYEDDFGADVEIMIRKFHLPHRFPPAVLDEAQNAEPVIPASESRKRRDFRAFPIVTIDGETARDFDDAVAVRRLENGNFELQVHIADVAHYVTPDSALDQEARLRGTSVYFPDRAVPMLPLELSTDICSLRPKVDRLVMSCVMEMDHRGEIVGYELSEGIIRSAERMTYTDVNLVLEGDAGARQRYAELVPGFELMRDLALILNRKRERRGSIDFDLPEPVIEFDEFGLMKSITRSERNFAHRLIEEFMLSANECVASHLENKRIASLYRIHEKPDAKRVYDFEVIAATFGYSLGVGPLPIHRVQPKTDRRANYGTGKRTREIEIPKEVHITPRMYQKLTEKIAGKPEERILSFLMLRSLKQARYSEENLGHFALAATSYTHFTSPIRRYPDLIVHRILKEVLRDATSDRSAGVPPARGRTERPQEQTDSSSRSRRIEGVLRKSMQAPHPSGLPARHRAGGTPALLAMVEAARSLGSARSRPTRRRSHFARGTARYRGRFQPVRTPRRRGRARADGMEKGQIHAGSRGRRLRRADYQRDQVRILCRADRPFRGGTGPAGHADRRSLHLSREHARNYRTAQPQDLQSGTKNPSAGGPDRSGGEENPVCGAGGKARSEAQESLKLV